MRIPRLAGPLLLAAALAAADPAFDDQRKALAEQLKARSLDAGALAPFDALVQAAGDDAQRANALGMLATACAKAEQHQRAADAFARLADLERARPGADRDQRVWNARIGRLRALAQIKPLPGAALAEAAQRELSAGDPAPTPPQRLELSVLAARGLAAGDPAAAPAWLAAQAEACGDAWLRVELRLQTADAQQRANAGADAQATWAGIAADAQAAPQQRAAALLAQAQALDRARRPNDALALVPRLLPEAAQAVQAGWKPDWNILQGLRWSAQLARRLGGHAQAEAAAACLEGIAPDAGWRAGARLELAAVRCAQARWEEAEQLYAGIAAADDKRSAAEARLALAFVVYRDRGDAARGLPLVDAALADAAIPHQLRGGAVMAEARRLLARGDRAGAASWFARIEGLPGGDGERARAWSQALVELGAIAESRADAAAAKAFYRRALDMADGELGARLRARDAIAGITYFE